MHDVQGTERSLQSLLPMLLKLEVPYAWLKALDNHSTVVLLAEIVAAYAGSGGSSTTRWQGPEFLLDYKALSKCLGISERSLTRATKQLRARKLITYQRKDRIVDGKMVWNVVGVVPRVAAIAKLSGIPRNAVVAGSRPGAGRDNARHRLWRWNSAAIPETRLECFRPRDPVRRKAGTL